MSYDAYAPRAPHANAGAKAPSKPKKATGGKRKSEPAGEATPLPGDAVRAENSAGIAAGQLRAFIERIERLEAEKTEIASDIKDVYGEAKAMGFDAKILRRVVAIRKQDPDERAEYEAVLDTYLHALGMGGA